MHQICLLASRTFPMLRVCSRHFKPAREIYSGSSLSYRECDDDGDNDVVSHITEPGGLPVCLPLRPIDLRLSL